MLNVDDLFKGRHFDRVIIVLCVRLYLRYKLSFRDLVEMMAERGLSLAHTTIMRWIQRYVPEFERRWNRFARPAGRSWRVDETYVKIKGRWTYLYRAVDTEGKTVDFLLRAKRDAAAAKAFFRLAFRRQGRLPLKITLDGYQASHRAAKQPVDEVPVFQFRVGSAATMTIAASSPSTVAIRAKTSAASVLRTMIRACRVSAASLGVPCRVDAISKAA